MSSWLRSVFGSKQLAPEEARALLKRMNELEDALAGLSERFNRLQKTRIAGGGGDGNADLLKLLLAQRGSPGNNPDFPL
jgi:hypothetical protein